MKFIILALFLAGCLFSTNANAELKDWTPQDQRLYGSLITLQAMDMMQTFALVECQERNPYCPYREKNRIIGSNPSKSDVIVLKLGINFMMYKILDNRIPSKNRTAALGLLNAVSFYPVIHNEQIGLGFYIPILPYKNFINK